MAVETHQGGGRVVVLTPRDLEEARRARLTRDERRREAGLPLPPDPGFEGSGMDPLDRQGAGNSGSPPEAA